MQARTFDAYVAGTRTGNEWATEMCVSSLAKALNISIRAISTFDGEYQLPSALVSDYVDGVTSDVFISIAFNKASQHYVGIAHNHIVPPTQVNTKSVFTDVADDMSCDFDTPVRNDHFPMDFTLADGVESMSFSDVLQTPVSHSPVNVISSSCPSFVSSMNTDQANDSFSDQCPILTNSPSVNITNIVLDMPMNGTCCNCKRQEND